MNEEGREEKEGEKEGGGKRERVGTWKKGGDKRMIPNLPIKKIINMLSRVFPPRTL